MVGDDREPGESQRLPEEYREANVDQVQAWLSDQKGGNVVPLTQIIWLPLTHEFFASPKVSPARNRCCGWLPAGIATRMA